MIKNELLEFLEENKGDFVNGQDIADKLSITRSAVWKNIKQLRNDGYIIEAIPNKGYRLSEENDILTEQSITPYLEGKAKNCHIDVRKSLPSTNTELKKLAAAGEKEGMILVANEQTAGRGRMGRSFYSPSDSGIYMSILLRPELHAENAVLLTTLTAVSAARAIEQVCGIQVGIKWVNDLYFNDKKIAGILTEGGINMENGMLEYAVVGIGVNVSTSYFPEEIKSTAASVSADGRRISRSYLAAQIINRLIADLPELEKKTYMPEYKVRSILLGREIYVLKSGERIPAVAVDIDENAALVVRYSDGSTEKLSSNDVSVRPSIKTEK
jgi:BirA family biotin operon repressor/biotin-[acetyl-CoA-carboxylase] ligase